MNNNYYWTCAVSVVIAAIALPFALTGQMAFARLQNRSGLTLTDAVRARVRSRIIGGILAVAIGAFVLGTVAALLIPYEPISHWRVNNGRELLVLPAFVLGAVVGLAIHLAASDGRGWSTESTPSESRSVRIGVYLDRGRLILSGCLIAFFAAVALIQALARESGAIQLNDPILSSANTFALAFSVVGVIVIFAAGRLPVPRDWFVGTNEDRAWNDALRADQLRGILYLVIAVCGTAFISTAIVYLGSGPKSGSDLNYLIYWLSSACWLATLAVMPLNANRGDLRWLTTLWPEIAALVNLRALELPPRRGARWLWSRPSDPDFPLAGPITVKPPVDSQ